MLLSNEGLECLGHLQAAVAHAGFNAGDGDGDLLEPWVVEEGVEGRLGARVAREVALAIDMLLAPHLRGRLRSLELLGPILNDRVNGPDAPR